jgi:electron transfer flavoprotein beta subunit
MYIVVCVKMVPDTTQVKIDPETNTLVREGVPFITNPFDTHAVEEALRLKDRYGAHVTAISMGPPAAESVLRRAIALGIDDGILISDRAFGGADTLATSHVLTEAIAKLGEKEAVDLVICGKQTIDGDTAQVGPGIASRLGFSQLTLVDKILEIDQKSKIIRLQRKLEDHHETVESTLPALLTVEREINLPRYPTVPGRLDATELNLPVWTNSVLKLDPKTIGLQGSPTQVRKIFAPEREKGEIIPGEGDKKEQAVKTMFDKLVDWDFATPEIQNGRR